MANQTKGVFGNGHTSAFVQDKGGNWYFFYWGDTVSVSKVDDPSVLLDAKSMNKWLRTKKLIKDDIDYDGFCYIPGDFTASLSYYNKLVTDTEKGLIFENKDYNLFTRNCTEETMNGLMKGKLSNGTSVGTYYLSLYSIAVIPNANIHNLQMAFMNSACTRTGFNSQVSSNLQNAKSYLSKMYGDYSDPEGHFSKNQVNATKKIINMMRVLLVLH